MEPLFQVYFIFVKQSFAEHPVIRWYLYIQSDAGKMNRNRQLRAEHN